MSIPLNSKWKCTDEELEQHGLIGFVVDVEDNPDYNGDGEIEIKHEDGTVAIMKVRRFYLRYQRIE